MAMWHVSDKGPCDEGFRLVLMGVGAMNTPRFAPAGLLVEHDESRVMIDGGSGADPRGRLDAWLVTDERAELIREIRGLAQDKGLEPGVGSFSCRDLDIRPRPVTHTSHEAFGVSSMRPTIRAMHAGERPGFGEFVYEITSS